MRKWKFKFEMQKTLLELGLDIPTYGKCRINRSLEEIWTTLMNGKESSMKSKKWKKLFQATRRLNSLESFELSSRVLRKKSILDLRIFRKKWSKSFTRISMFRWKISTLELLQAKTNLKSPLLIIQKLMLRLSSLTSSKVRAMKISGKRNLIILSQDMSCWKRRNSTSQ